MRSESALLESVRKTVKATARDEIIRKTEQLLEEIKRSHKLIEEAQRKVIDESVKGALVGAIEIGGLRFIRGGFKNVPADVLRGAVDDIISRDEAAVCLFSIESEGKVQLVAGCGPAAVKAGAHAGNLLKAVSPIVGGGGGGRPNSAQSGGKLPEKLGEAMKEAERILVAQIKE